MSALTDLFTAMANKIRSKTGTATTYTPLEMVSDGIDDVYDAGYAAGGGGGGTATPITPSNSSPASMTTGTTYEAMGTGYAIENCLNVTPSDSPPASLSNGGIYKMGDSGYAIKNSPATLTPNNTNPPSIASGTIYKGGGTGKAIESIATNGNGVTPSSSGEYFASGWNRMTASGYAYATEQPKVKIGTGTISTSTSTTFTVGFRPKYLGIWISNAAGTTTHVTAVYDERYSTTKYLGAGASTYLTSWDLGSSNNNRLTSITDTGFTWAKSSSSTNLNLRYFAIG